MPFDSAEFERFTSFLKDMLEKYGAEILLEIEDGICDDVNTTE